MQNTEKFSAYQMKDGKFNKYDTIVRYLAVENYFGNNDYGFKLYNKMPLKRGFLEGAEDKFRILFKSIYENGFDECSALPVGKDQELKDGSHTLALYFNEKLAPLKLSKFAYIYITDYSIEWNSSSE